MQDPGANFKEKKSDFGHLLADLAKIPLCAAPPDQSFGHAFPVCSAESGRAVGRLVHSAGSGVGSSDKLSGLSGLPGVQHR